MTIVRTPLFFGPDERSLFGWYHAAESGTNGDLAVLVCPPLGHEYVNSHRSMRHLTDRIAEAGIPAMRFDYDGTGDSAGGDEDPRRLEAWLQSIRVAIETLRELSGCRRIALAGARFGATLAALTAAELDVATLVLWTPVVRGRAYMRELKALQLTGATRESKELEPGGFLYTEETQREVGAIDLEEIAPKTARVLIVGRNDLTEDTRLRDRWRARGIEVEQVGAPGYNEMYAPPHETVVPSEAIALSVQWLIALNGGERRAPAATPVRNEQRVDGIRESLVRFGDNVFGIVSEPDAPRGPAILLSNGGATHHIGPNRLYVGLARTLSRAGFRVFRYDLPGLGDSVIADAARENDTYLPETTDIIAAAMDALQSGPFVSMGLCSGAHAAFHAGRVVERAALIECVLINPLTYYYKSGMSLSESPAVHHEEWQRYLISLRRPDGWSKLLRGDVNLRGVLRTVYSRTRDIVLSKLRRFRKTVVPLPSVRLNDDDLADDVRRITARGRRLTFVFSRSDPGYDLLMINAGRVVQRLRKKDLVQVWRIDNANHTFEARSSREVMIRTLVQHLEQRYLAA
jgi:alpha-beta hydrolase superfamily lysophospholipase